MCEHRGVSLLQSTRGAPELETTCAGQHTGTADAAAVIASHLDISHYQALLPPGRLDYGSNNPEYVHTAQLSQYVF